MEDKRIILAVETHIEPATKSNPATELITELAKKGLEKTTQEHAAPDVPLWEKYTLTIREAAEYFHIGEKRLRQIAEENINSDFVMTNGNRIMIKRKAFEKYIDNATVI